MAASYMIRSLNTVSLLARVRWVIRLTAHGERMFPRLGDLSRRYTLTPVPCPRVFSIGDGGIRMGVLLFCTFSICRLRSLRRGVSMLGLLRLRQDMKTAETAE